MKTAASYLKRASASVSVLLWLGEGGFLCNGRWAAGCGLLWLMAAEAEDAVCDERADDRVWGSGWRWACGNVRRGSGVRCEGRGRRIWGRGRGSCDTVLKCMVWCRDDVAVRLLITRSPDNPPTLPPPIAPKTQRSPTQHVLPRHQHHAPGPTRQLQAWRHRRRSRALWKQPAE